MKIMSQATTFWLLTGARGVQVDRGKARNASIDVEAIAGCLPRLGRKEKDYLKCELVFTFPFSGLSQSTSVGRCFVSKPPCLATSLLQHM